MTRRKKETKEERRSRLLKEYGTSWKECIGEAISEKEGLNWDAVVYHTFTEEELNQVFIEEDDIAMMPWTVWTKKRVYFLEGYDSGSCVVSVPRNPCDEKVKYIGGGCYIPSQYREE